MKILVFIKATLDSECQIKLTKDLKSIDQGSQKNIINPYDEHALEQAIQLKEAKHAHEIVVLLLGKKSQKEQLLRALAMGCDRGILVTKEDISAYDPRATASILSKIVQEEQPQLVFAGKQAIDGNNMLVPAMVAKLLDWPCVSGISDLLETTPSSITVKRSIGGGKQQICQLSFPAIITADKSLNKPRYVSLPGIMRAKKKVLHIRDISEFHLFFQDDGCLELVGYRLPQKKVRGKQFSHEAIDTMVAKLLNLLHHEAKVL